MAIKTNISGYFNDFKSYVLSKVEVRQIHIQETY